MNNEKKPDEMPESETTQMANAPADPATGDAKEPEMATGEDGELLPDPLEELKTEIADLKDRYLRQAAEMDNLRKRTEREKADMAKYAISNFARDILPLSDNFQRAIDAVPAEAAEQDEALNSFLEGVKMNERELQKVLERHGVTKIDPQGEKFDPNMHQAVQQVENCDLPNNTVCEVYQVGYVMADRVLRPAVVAVAKGGAQKSADREPPLTLPENNQPGQDPSAASSDEKQPEQTESVAEPGAKIDKSA